MTSLMLVTGREQLDVSTDIGNKISFFIIFIEKSNKIRGRISASRLLHLYPRILILALFCYRLELTDQTLVEVLLKSFQVLYSSA